MKTDTTNPASVTTCLTDEEIMKFSKMAEYNFSNDAAAVLRDYVRLRKLVNAVKACVDAIHANNCCGDDYGSIRELKRLLAEAEEGGNDE